MNTIKKTLIIFSLLLFTLPGHTTSPDVLLHDEVVGKLVFEQRNNTLYITATFDKRLLALALKKEAKCSPQDMMNSCADEYIRQNIKIRINNQALPYHKTGQKFQKRHMVYAFEASFADNIQEIQVTSTYLLKYNTHAIVKALFLLNQRNRSFSLNHRRKSIQVSYSK
ncbi:DUF6702 family protein [Microscilla marina]|uniref:Uncharacterized protein n=1 Tax=Microscilla marina ATCC 23134 TaxID=313606 RepID=A2A0F0_MICM2|nr:DUF6702 family protein [Microscilla marina]EAY23889.1 hypothetical protein M23134_06499 [Microscilla marina ATCC 23134]